MRRFILLSFLLLLSSLAVGQTGSRKDVDITAPDGTKLRATLFSAHKPGPGVLLLHMCNTTRKSWEPVAVRLSEKGINALTIDNRGFGESGGPRFEGASPQQMNELHEKWPGDFDAAYQFLLTQSGVDNQRIAAGGGSCGVDNVIKLAERHPEVKALVLLAGGTDIAGTNFIAQHPERPIFTAAAADDEYNPATVEMMRSFSELSGNPRTKFSGFKDGRHGTEIFGPHPELVGQIVDFFVDTLITSPVDLKSPMRVRKTSTAEFWALLNQPDGAARAVQFFHDSRQKDPNALVFPEYPMNMLGYSLLHSGKTDQAIDLFMLNTEAYPASANAQDSLSDGYLAAGKKDLALRAEEKCLELLPNDPNDRTFKTQLEEQARAKIAKLRSEQK